MAKSTGYFKGDLIEYTDVVTDDGFMEFVYLEGEKVGQTGVMPTPAQRQADVERKRTQYREEQAGFRRLRNVQR